MIKNVRRATLQKMSTGILKHILGFCNVTELVEEETNKRGSLSCS